MSNTQDNKGKLGFLAIFSTVVGMVIGIGIFAKSNGVVAAAGGSTWAALTAWLLVAVIMVAMTISFVEVASTTKKGETGTIGTWASKFFGPTTGKSLSALLNYIVLPAAAVTIGYFTTTYFTGALNYIPGIASQFLANPWLKPLIETITTLVMVFGLFFALYYRNSQYKVIQIATVGIKVIPLFLVMIAGITYSINPTNGNGLGEASNIANGQAALQDGGQFVLAVLLAMPPILFTIDGFIYGAALQKEAKDKKTFMWAFISGMLFIIVVYLGVSIATMVIGNGPDEYSVENTLGQAWPEVKGWIGIAMSILIFISGFGAVNGFTMTGSRSVEEMENAGEIKPTGATFRNRFDVPQKSVVTFAKVAAFWFISSFALEWIFWALPNNTSDFGDIIIDPISDMTTVLAFVAYGLVIFGGLRNRYLMKKDDKRAVGVEKVNGFVTASVIGILMIVTITSVNLYNYLSDWEGKAAVVLATVASITLWIILTFYFYFTTKEGFEGVKIPGFKKPIFVGMTKEEIKRTSKINGLLAKKEKQKAADKIEAYTNLK